MDSIISVFELEKRIEVRNEKLKTEMLEKLKVGASRDMNVSPLVNGKHLGVWRYVLTTFRSFDRLVSSAFLFVVVNLNINSSFIPELYKNTIKTKTNPTTYIRSTSAYAE